MSCAELQDWARRDGAAPGDVATALWEERTLVRTWCMRGTLHLLTPEQHACYTAAFDPAVHYNATWMRAFGVTEADLERVYEALAEALDGGEALSRRDLAAALTDRVGDRLGERLRSGWGELLKPAARRGLIVNGPSRGQEVTYVRTDRWLGPRAVAAADPSTARAAYLRAYLGAYGPASRQDYARWLGIRTLGPVDEAVQTLGDEVAEVGVTGKRVLALRADLDELSAATAAADGDLPVCFLPGFDPFVLGHADRDHLVAKEFRSLVYRTAGWISPTVLVDGAVAGTWEHRVEGVSLAVRVTPFGPLRRREREGVEAEAQRLAAYFDRRLALYT